MGDDDRADIVDHKRKVEMKQRIVAAKVELANFVDSGVIDGEASVLKFLDASLPVGMVPTFVDYVRQPAASIAATATAATAGTAEKGSTDGGLSAIVMECLPGEDMHLLRDRHCQSLVEKADGVAEKAQRRLSVEDAVYLVADVMLPLLKAMHQVGMVHRDVKPSVSLFQMLSYLANEEQTCPGITLRIIIFQDKNSLLCRFFFVRFNVFYGAYQWQTYHSTKKSVQPMKNKIALELLRNNAG